MSKVWKSVKKTFRAAFKVVKKVAKIAVIASVVYFTAGAAATMFPAISGFAGAIQGAAGGLLKGIASAGQSIWQAGTNMVTGAANAAGLGTATTTATTTGTATATGTAGSFANATMTAGEEALAAGLEGFTGATGVSNVTAAASPSMLAKASAALGEMSLTDKLLLGKVGVDTVAGLTAPTMDSKAKAAKEWRGSFYGREDDGSGGGAHGSQALFGEASRPQSGLAVRPTPVATGAERMAQAPQVDQLTGQQRTAATRPQSMLFPTGQDMAQQATAGAQPAALYA